MARKTLVIGWDAADWKVVHALIEQGRMPHTQALIERGVMGDLATLQPVLSPMLWASIATGKRPFKHGILGFTEPTPDGAGIQPVSQLGRTTKAIWNIFHQQGLRQHVIGWWPSHPVEPIDGVMVSNHFQLALGPPDAPWPLAPGMVHPPHLADTLAALRINPNELLPEQVLRFVPRAAEIDQDQDKRLGMVMKILAECVSVHAAALWALEHEPWDFAAVYYDGIDHFCHGFMKYRAPRRAHIPERDFALYAGVVDMAYVFHDLMLGAMLAVVPADTTVVICSDHGFHPDHLRPVLLPKEPAGPALEHRDLGLLIMAGPGLKQDHLLHGASVLDITPTLLALHGLPVGEDMDGKVLVDAFVAPPAVAMIPSWDAVPGDAARLDAEHCYDPIAAKEAMDQLVALGYVAAPAADQAEAVASTARELRYNLARSYMDAGRYLDAVPVLADLSADAPDQFRFGVQLAQCYRALGLVPELRALVERLTLARQAAALEAREALRGLTEQLEARQAAAGQLGADGRIDPERLDEGERREYDRLRLLARFGTFDLDYLMGWVLIAEGRPEQALAHLKRAEQADARRPGLHVQIGETLFALGRIDDAEGAFARALALDPLSAHASLGLAKVRLRQRRTDDAIRLALASVSALYQNPVAHYVLGLGLWRAGQYVRAAEAMRVAVGINPNFERAQRFLARYALRFEQDLAKSRAHWRLVREIRAQTRERRLTRLADAALLVEGLATEPPPGELDGDGNRPRLAIGGDDWTATSRPAGAAVVDKSAVPAHWRDCITVVSGLPRTGTSLMMQMLAAGGIPPLTDGERGADADNPRGYFEHRAATRLRQQTDWLRDAKGGAVKIVAQLLPHLPGEHHYRILFMERDLGEVLRSQSAMLRRLGRAAAKLSDAQLAATYRRQLRQVAAWLARQPNCSVLHVPHAAAVADPGGTAARVAAFLGGDLDVAAMAAMVDPALYRQRAVPAAAPAAPD
jgi:predicted AlkP superfamily phosphohydrolase/phosphomutase/tetratricopeptide (TPR) repeat protein